VRLPGRPAPLDVIVPTRNRPRLLAEAVERLLAQSVPVASVTVVRDRGDMGGAALPSSPLLRVVESSGAPGAPGARNIGLTLATADWVVFHDDDDLWDERFAEVVGDVCAAAADDVVAVFPGFRIEFPSRPPREVPAPAREPSVDLLLERNAVGPCSFVACRRRAVIAAGGFDESLPGAQDWDLWLRLAERGRLLPVPRSLGVYRSHGPGQISSPSPSERFRRYGPFYEKRMRHSRARHHRGAFASELYWWGVLMGWTGDVTGAVAALSGAIALRPAGLKARAMRAVVRSPLRRGLLAAVYGRRRDRMRLEDRDEALDLA
jgi:glycosyltransferase involved in cell wall biosynthesis